VIGHLLWMEKGIGRKMDARRDGVCEKWSACGKGVTIWN
jgi:hypothetical protein